MVKIKKIFLIIISIFFIINSSNIVCFATTGGSPSNAPTTGTPSGGNTIMGYPSSCPSCTLNESTSASKIYAWRYKKINNSSDRIIKGYRIDYIAGPSDTDMYYIVIASDSNNPGGAGGAAFSWQIVAAYGFTIPRDDSFVNGSRVTDSNALNELANCGYSYGSGAYSSALYYNGSKYLNFVAYVSQYSEWVTNDRTKITYVNNSNNSDDNFDAVGDGWSLKKIYNEAPTEVTYHGKTEQTDTNKNWNIVEKTMTVRKHECILFNGDGTSTGQKGNCGGNSETYYTNEGEHGPYTKTVKWDIQNPTVEQTWFRPFDLNRNGQAVESEVKSTYPAYANGSPSLKIYVNNMQSITDGSKLKTLDTNTSTPFKISISNNQLGIPTQSQGGFTLNDALPGSSYRINGQYFNHDVIWNIGGLETRTNGKLYVDGNVYSNIDGLTTQNVHWNGSVKGALNNGSASLTYGGEEKLGTQTLTFSKGWLGGQFIFKTTKMAIYSLSNGSGRNWWEINYDQGRYFEYGVEFKGTININGISNPTIVNKNMYAKLISKSLVQPILKGLFEAKTVGGNIG